MIPISPPFVEENLHVLTGGFGRDRRTEEICAHSTGDKPPSMP
jgi:hypothetical protein